MLSLFYGQGDDLLYMICSSIDEEKDPQCLMHAFHIVERAAQVFAGPSSPVANYSAELFDVLGSYFPIHFTHVSSSGLCM